MRKNLNLKLLSFFTGGGFLDIGFEQAGFDIVWTNELNHTFSDIYESGVTSWRRRQNKIVNATISNHNSICDITSNVIIKEAFGGIKENCFGIIGGPPCPDFSKGGRHAGGAGPNGYLTGVFIDRICELNPDFFLLENVFGLYRFQKHRAFLLEQIDKLYRKKYILDHTILDALDFSVPQTRERFFLIGFKKKIVENILKRKLNIKEKNWFSWPQPKYHHAKKIFQWPDKNEFGTTPKIPSKVPIELTVWYALNHPKRCLQLPNSNDFFHPYSDKFFRIMEGDVSGYSFKRLHRYRFSPTVWYGHQEVHLHPWEPRRLSVREALRIQTVPDEYIMPEKINLSAKFKLACNGVPCVLGYEIARSLRNFINYN
jgi:DNA (cytosine-5)-methyltransferase 1